jgi:hypothetical protein
MAHSRQIDHKSAITGAETGKAVATTAQGGEDCHFSSGPDGGLYVAHIGAASNKPGSASYHAIPNDARIFILAVAGAQ